MKNLFPLFILFFAVSINAATFTVTRSDDRDAVCISGVDCSLREAINAANIREFDDNVDFAPGITNIVLTDEIQIGRENSDNYGSLSIRGSGANVLTIDGGVGTNRIFYINFRKNVIISGMTLTGGNGTGAMDSGSGGAIYSQGLEVMLRDVHVTGNTATSGGGAFFRDYSSATRISNSTFSGNTANVGAGFFCDGSLAIVNSTISDNTADLTAGGIMFTGLARLVNVTITNNKANNGGGITKFGNGTINISNTIIAGNTATSGVAPDIRFESGSFSSVGGNLVGDSIGDSTNTGVNYISYRTSDIRDVDPRLDTLKLNGGTTPNHALLAGSPAIDAGLNALAFDPFNGNPLLTDQRGFRRIFDGNNDGVAVVDIGAFEVQQTPTAAMVSLSGKVTDGRRGIANATVQLTSQDGITQAVRTNFFGNFRFDEVAAGEMYVITVQAKRFRFNPLIINVTEDLEGINFVAQRTY